MVREVDLENIRPCLLITAAETNFQAGGVHLPRDEGKQLVDHFLLPSVRMSSVKDKFILEKDQERMIVRGKKRLVSRVLHKASGMRASQSSPLSPSAASPIVLWGPAVVNWTQECNLQEAVGADRWLELKVRISRKEPMFLEHIKDLVMEELQELGFKCRLSAVVTDVGGHQHEGGAGTGHGSGQHVQRKLTQEATARVTRSAAAKGPEAGSKPDATKTATQKGKGKAVAASQAPSAEADKGAVPAAKMPQKAASAAGSATGKAGEGSKSQSSTPDSDSQGGGQDEAQGPAPKPAAGTIATQQEEEEDVAGPSVAAALEAAADPADAAEADAADDGEEDAAAQTAGTATPQAAAHPTQPQQPAATLKPKHIKRPPYGVKIRPPAPVEVTTLKIVHGPTRQSFLSFWDDLDIAEEMACLLEDAQQGPSSTQIALLTNLEVDELDAAGKPIRPKYDNFLLSGPPGSGKSMACLAAAARKQLQSAGMTAVIICGCEQEAQQTYEKLQRFCTAGGPRDQTSMKSFARQAQPSCLLIRAQANYVPLSHGIEYLVGTAEHLSAYISTQPHGELGAYDCMGLVLVTHELDQASAGPMRQLLQTLSSNIDPEKQQRVIVDPHGNVSRVLSILPREAYSLLHIAATAMGEEDHPQPQTPEAIKADAKDTPATNVGNPSSAVRKSGRDRKLPWKLRDEASTKPKG